MRLFVAVWPPPALVERVASLMPATEPALRWTAPAKLHVTLRFLGDVGVPDAVADALSAADLGPPRRARVGPATGRFGHRVLHLPVAGIEPLAAAVVDATAAIGEPPDPRPFAGHLTLARARSRRADLRPLAGMPFAGEWDVDEVTLVRSAGGRYEIVQRWALTP